MMPVLTLSSPEISEPMKKISLSLPSVKPLCVIVAVLSWLELMPVRRRSTARSAPPYIVTEAKNPDDGASPVVWVSVTPSVVVVAVPLKRTEPSTSKTTYALVFDLRVSQSTLADASSSWWVMQKLFVKSLKPREILLCAATPVSSTASKEIVIRQAFGVPNPDLIKLVVPPADVDRAALILATLTSPAMI